MVQFSCADYELYRSPKRVRVVLGGQVIADSRRVLLLRCEEAPPVYYFPIGDLHEGILSESEQMISRPGWGEAKRYNVSINGTTEPDSAWMLTHPIPELTELTDHVAFDWNAMEAWFEEDQEVFVHPHDPRKRIDTAISSAHIRILLNGETVADSYRPTLLFETGLVTRYYLPRMDIRQELLVPSKLVTYCPYKGEARYYSLRQGSTVLEDVIWYYRYTTLEAAPIAGLLCFYQERITLEVDGQRIG